ncbi:putative gustatory receptor 28b [Ischnura elegans]|uniref:putative gustatory receptor 28b n=1 Tax=Ischnura elegans TaxID=197161 RepID=UPI001ED896E3|nr:putative gustatory receptor 28b [Ischnura elegans]
MELLLKTRDRKTRRELRTLISQMHHGRIYLSACGIFKLDYTVIKSMVTGVITYIVILMQFMPLNDEKSTDDKDKG